jgi:hypothetical protein
MIIHGARPTDTVRNDGRRCKREGLNPNGTLRVHAHAWPTEHFPVGSVEWSQRISNQLQIATDTVSYDVEHHVARCLKQVLSADPKPWEVWPGGKPFETPDAWTRAVTGHLGSSRPDRQ